MIADQSSPHVIRDLDIVRALVACTTDEGYPIPAGSTGTVVSIYRGGGAYCVEFTDAEHPHGGLLVDLRANEVRFVPPSEDIA